MDADGTTPTVQKSRNPIFVEDFTDLERPFDALSERFSSEGLWLAPFATTATQEGETLRMRIGPSWASGLVTREVQVTLWPVRERDNALARAISWVPSEWQSLFPLLEGDMELAPIGQGWSRLSLAVIYTVPLGAFGARVDRAVMHRVAASTVRSFLAQVGGSLLSGVEPS
ncbi:MAG: hypothetical protein ABSC34_05040 [Acidimicrobiales bacterium]|jgi:hypothetical protein